MIKRIGSMLLLLMIILFVLPMTVSANSPPEAEFSEPIGNPLEKTDMGQYAAGALMGVLLTCALELAVAVPFSLHKSFGKQILITNLITQVLMHACFVCGCYFLEVPYKTLIFALELLIYAAELLVYYLTFRKLSLWRCFAYTVLANSVSLWLGHLLISKLIFG